MGLPNIGPLELIIILAIALLIVGPGRLPEMGNAIGKTIREFRKASTDMTDAATIETDPQSAAAATVAPAQVAAATSTAAEPVATSTPAEPQPDTLSEAAEPNTAATPATAAATPEPTADGKADA